MKKNAVIKHLKGDIQTFKKEAMEDKELIKKLKPKKKASKAPKKSKSHEKKESKGEKKFERVMREYKEGKLHVGSKKGPKAKDKKQALAIAFSEKRRANKK